MNTLDRIAMLETEDCEVCQYQAEHGSYPLYNGNQRQSHCGDNAQLGIKGCHQSWTSMSQAHCTVCHGQFATNGTADFHWREPKGKDVYHVDWRDLRIQSGEYEGEPILFEADESMGPVIHRATYGDNDKASVFA